MKSEFDFDKQKEVSFGMCDDAFVVKHFIYGKMSQELMSTFANLSHEALLWGAVDLAFKSLALRPGESYFQ